VLNKLHRDSDAIASYLRALDLNPGETNIRANLALLYEQSNQLDKAEALAQQGLVDQPHHISLLLTAARCARRAKKYQVALDYLHQMPETMTSGFVAPQNLSEAGFTT